jgi:hypothetical protein
MINAKKNYLIDLKIQLLSLFDCVALKCKRLGRLDVGSEKFQVHYILLSCQHKCRQCYTGNCEASDLNLSNTNVTAACKMGPLDWGDGNTTRRNTRTKTKETTLEEHFQRLLYRVKDNQFRTLTVCRFFSLFYLLQTQIKPYYTIAYAGEGVTSEYSFALPLPPQPSVTIVFVSFHTELLMDYAACKKRFR